MHLPILAGLGAAVLLLSGAASAAPAATIRAQIDHLEDQVGTFDDRAALGAPVLTACTGLPYGAERLACAQAGARFAQAWTGAHHGDLVAARLVADCLAHGCTTAVRPRPTDGCAWSLVVAAIGSEPEADRPRARLACARLDAKALGTAKVQALQLGRQLPALRT